jgi:hypothetical protein
VEVIGQTLGQLIAGMRQIRPEAIHRTFTAPAHAGPHLSARFLGLHKQHKPLPLGPVGQKQRHRIRLIETREVPEVAVLAKGPLAISVMGHQRGRRNHGSRTAQPLNKASAALGKHGWCVQHESARY